MSLAATYLPGSTTIHRLPAGLKLGLLAATGVALAILNRWWEPLALLGVVLACYRLAGSRCEPFPCSCGRWAGSCWPSVSFSWSSQGGAPWSTSW